ncbi:inorganic phosphate transporter [Psychroflexus sp. ALD_RP9]|uniref:inorganic phosphate transporter n=1 Tax=Psychroflexus sp. ALD_RP9 TaxID=2777186 RepID=UPI001A8D9A98|nr:inorganic phosphate transporter [Psychroflexus sp. ALD_RP9]QSS96219.1 inorganic phosphate transporter [Psychroflexus sp. ALD_RP9]
MENLYIILVVLLFLLAVADLIVGVSNDAVNFLNSAIGSKAIPMKTILIVAGLGVLVGAVFSSGLMEVARNGIFNPNVFYFNEIIIIFLAVLITDILILDFFNTIGIPTSTTVSIVFELLGAAVSVSLLKMYYDPELSRNLGEFINLTKATEISLGIILSIFIAFFVGAIVQFISRLIFSFNYQKKLKFIGALFGGVSLSAITYFILIKGVNTIDFIDPNFAVLVQNNKLFVVGISLLIWIVLSQLLISVFKVNILKLIVIVGTFALALAFAGNDLVNFIGVSIASYQSFMLWQDAFLANGVLPSQFLMSGLDGEVQTPEYILVIAGFVMVLTLWFSSKAQYVVQTGVNLGRQGEGDERFKANNLSRTIVRYAMFIGQTFSQLLEEKLQHKISSRFDKPEQALNYTTSPTKPAFDLLRASINLVLASILISIGTNFTLPLSTTYVTFMVAMGTSFGDRAWDRDSAVYRVAGVFNVIASWFGTALLAFSASAVVALVIWYGGNYAIVVLVILAGLSVVRNAIKHSKKTKIEQQQKRFNRTDIITINEITIESSKNMTSVIKGNNRLLRDVINNLGYHDSSRFKKSLSQLEQQENEIDELKDNVFYYIKSLEENTVEASKFYILTLDYLQEIVQSMAYITRSSHKHVNNNHKNLKFNQIRDLKRIDAELNEVNKKMIFVFENQDFTEIKLLVAKYESLGEKISGLIQKQIERLKVDDNSPKNTKLYFGLLLELKDLVNSTLQMMHLFQEYYNEAKKEF